MKRSHFTPWLLTTDVLAAVTAFGLAFAIRFHSGLFEVALGIPPFRPYGALLPVVALLWPLVFAGKQLYRPFRGRQLIDDVYPIAIACTIATASLFGADAYYRLYHLRSVEMGARFQYSRGFIAGFVLLDIALTVAARAGIRRFAEGRRRRGLNVRRVLIVGAGELGRSVAERLLEHPDYGYAIAGFADDDPAKKGKRFEGVPVLGTTDDVMGLIQQERIDELFFCLPWAAHDCLLRLLSEAGKEGVDAKVVPDLLQYIALRASFEDLDGIPLLDLARDPLGPVGRFTKRAVDIIGAAAGLLLLAPALLFIAWRVSRSSPGPVFYRQERLGLDGRSFHMLKFRTMNLDAERHTGPVFADDDDPRATPIGRKLRSWSLDELPQVWQVLRGEMSIVGPRPERPSFVTEFKETIPRYMLRHKMKSGITGWAQVNGWRGNSSINKRIEHDLYYMRNWSLALDLKIIWMTLAGGMRNAPRRDDDN